jgi:DNA-binding NarL/FixJ family response regulator
MHSSPGIAKRNFTFPIRERASNPDHIMKKTSVLIVDDHRLIRETWKAMLGAVESIDIIGSCGDGQNAVKVAERTKPDIVLLDINMLPMSGIEVLKLIRKMSPISRMIVVSMHSEAAYARQLLRLGAKGFVTKNSSRDELMEAISEVSKGNIFICGEVRDNLDKEMIKRGGDIPDINCLSERELQVLSLLSAGGSSKDIAAELTIALKTVSVHRHNILKKMNLKNTPSLIRYIKSHEADW